MPWQLQLIAAVLPLLTKKVTFKAKIDRYVTVNWKPFSNDHSIKGTRSEIACWVLHGQNSLVYLLTVPRVTFCLLPFFLSGGFITAIVGNQPERKLAKRTSVQCDSELKCLITFGYWFWHLIAENRSIVLNFYQQRPVFALKNCQRHKGQKGQWRPTKASKVQNLKFLCYYHYSM